MNTPFFSIIFPIYNVQYYLRKSIESVLTQNFKSFELILIDDGSTDNSYQLIKEYSLKDDRVKVFHQKNSGVAAARNKGLAVSLGKYIYFMDPDDWISQGLLFEAHKVIQKYEVQMYVFGHNTVIDNVIRNKYFYDRGFLNRDNLKSSIKDIMLNNKLGTVWDKIFERKFLVNNKIKFPNLSNAQDGCFIFDTLKFVESSYFDKNIYYNFRMNRFGSTTSSFKKDMIVNCLKKLNRFEDLLHNFEIEDEGLYEKMYIEEILNFAIFENVTNFGAPKSLKRKKNYIIASLKQANFFKLKLNYNKGKKLISFPSRILFNLVNHKMFYFSLLFFLLKKNLKELKG